MKKSKSGLQTLKAGCEMHKIARKILLMIALMCVAVSGYAKDDKKASAGGEAKELSGISIVGNKEAPKSLFIVPWKSSEIGTETDLSSQLLNEKLEAVDIEVFERELDFYSATNR